MGNESYRDLNKEEVIFNKPIAEKADHFRQLLQPTRLATVTYASADMR